MSFPAKAVVILPWQNDRVLMQLRDDKPGIVYPGRWGFFGGSIESGESPIGSAKRELHEEIGYTTKEMFALSIDRISAPHDITLHSFYCPLMIHISQISLLEGFDFGLFTFKEVHSNQLFSAKANGNCPVIKHPYIEYLFKKFIQRIDTNKGTN